MTTTYKIDTETIVTTNTIGIVIERTNITDYWKVRFYVQDTFTNSMINALITKKTSLPISITDGTGTVTYTGTVVSWEADENYSQVTITNCTCTKV